MSIDWDIPYYFAKSYDGDLCIVFSIPLPHNNVYMKHNLTKHDDGYMLIVDTSQFIKMWRCSTDDDRFSGYHLGDKELWRRDHKFPFTEECFLLGEDNPVPVATNISYQPLFREEREISFSNDFTRTIWLLANDAPYFPLVAVSHEEAIAFCEDMGRRNCSIYSLSYLSNQAKNNVENSTCIQG